MKTILFEMISEWIRSYLKTAIKNAVDKGVDKTSSFMASIATVFLLIVFSSVVIIFLSLTLALWIGEYSGKPSLGFLAVSILYTIIFLLFYIFRTAWIKKPLAEKFGRELRNTLPGGNQ